MRFRASTIEHFTKEKNVLQQLPNEVDVLETKKELQESLRTFYIVARCNAFYTTLFLILTFFAETVLNTIRLNEKLKNVFAGIVGGWQPLRYFESFYPTGDKPIEIIASAHVYIYIFAIALYAGLRLVHHKTLAGEKDWPGRGELRGENLKQLSFFTRCCWYTTPRARVHQRVMRLWMWWAIMPLIATFPLSWLGIKVFTSENLVTALIGSVILFGVNLIEGSNFFKRMPAKEVLGRLALLLFTLGTKRDFAKFARDVSGFAEDIKNRDVEVTPEELKLLDDIVKRAESLARKIEKKEGEGSGDKP